MKTKFFLFYSSLLFTGLSYSQNALIEKSTLEVGKLKDITVEVVKTIEPLSNTAKSLVRIKHAPKWLMVSDTKTELSDAEEINELLKTMRELLTTVFNTTRKNPTEINTQSKAGIEFGGFYVFEKVSAAKAQAGASKTEKFYVATTAKMYEGKTVYEDAKGTYIWKAAATATPTSPGVIDTPGHWVTYFQVEKLVSASRISLTMDEFKALVELIEKAKLKM